jgi:hypothetical protein
VKIRPPLSVPLHPYPYGLWGIDVDLGGETLGCLLDTGAGITTIHTACAERAGLRPDGRLTGHRMIGERVDVGECTDVVLAMGGLPMHHDAVGILDLMAFLPEGFPPIGGVVALNTFEKQPVTFDFRNLRLTLESDGSLSERTSSMTPLEIRIGRPLQGLAAEVFVAVRRGDMKAWLELDSANAGPVLLDTHTALRLGLDVSEDRATPPCASLEVAPGQPWETEVVVRELIIDGNLGATFIGNRVLSLDLDKAELWIDRPP